MRPLFLLCAIAAASLTTQAQVRDRPPRAESAAVTGAVEGRVLVEQGGEHMPIRRAGVTLSGGPSTDLTTETDVDGRFRFERVPAARYQVVVEKPGYVPTTEHFVDVPRRTAASIVMARGAALEGRVLDTDGLPVGNLVVSADRISQTAGERATVDLRWERTDDLGRYRIHTLPPGDYRVHAAAPPGSSGDEMYFPGTPSEADAALITVAAGQTAENLDVVVAARPRPEFGTPDVSVLGSGSSSVSGLVTSAEAGQPLDADVTIECLSPSTTTRVQRTDGSGRFSFRGVPAGRCLLFAAAAGHFNSVGQPAVSSGGGRQPDRILDVREADDIGTAHVTLLPMRAIEGRVIDEYGDPVPGVVVQPMLRRVIAGRSWHDAVPPSATGTGLTDDFGAFRISGLPAGDYQLLVRSGIFHGGASQSSSMAAPGVAGFAPTYFPGTASLADAEALPLTNGADARGLTIPLVPVPVTTLEGAVVDPLGAPVPRASLVLTKVDELGLRATLGRSDNFLPSAKFSYRGVPPGTYNLLAIGPAGMSGHTVLDVPPQEQASTLHVTIALRPLSVIRGRIEFEGETRPDRDTVAVRLQPPITPRASAAPSAPTKPTGAWSFEMSHSVNFGLVDVVRPPGWTVKQVLLNGQDITDAPAQFGGRNVDDLRIVLADDAGAITGVVAGGDGPSARAQVVIFPADPAKRAPPSRYIAALRSDHEGAFRVPGLPPGEYLAIAISGLPMVVQTEPEWFAALEPQAAPFTVVARRTQSITVPLLKP